MLSGALPKSRQLFHAAICAFVCLAFGGLAVFHFELIFPSTGPRPNSSAIGLSAAFIALAIGAIAMQLWFRRRIVREFTYTGSALHIRTLGIHTMQTYSLSQVKDIREWRGRRGPVGYRVTFNDGWNAYIERTVENSDALLDRLLAGQPVSSDTPDRWHGRSARG